MKDAKSLNQALGNADGDGMSPGLIFISGPHTASDIAFNSVAAHSPRYRSSSGQFGIARRWQSSPVNIRIPATYTANAEMSGDCRHPERR